jgi:hypothetical protein
MSLCLPTASPRLPAGLSSTWINSASASVYTRSLDPYQSLDIFRYRLFPQYLDVRYSALPPFIDPPPTILLYFSTIPIDRPALPPFMKSPPACFYGTKTRSQTPFAMVDVCQTKYEAKIHDCPNCLQSYRKTFYNTSLYVMFLFSRWPPLGHRRHKAPYGNLYKLPLLNIFEIIP